MSNQVTLNNPRLDSKKQHLRASLLRGYLNILKTHSPDLNLNEVFHETGFDIADVHSDESWVSITAERQFMRNIRKLLPEEKLGNLCYKVGTMGATKETLGSTVFFLGKNVLALDEIFAGIVKFTSLYNKLIRAEIVLKDFGRISIRLTPVFENLNAAERAALVEALPDIIENTKGYYESIPQIKGLSSGQVVVEPDELGGFLLGVRYPQTTSLLRSLTPAGGIVLGTILWFLGYDSTTSLLIGTIAALTIFSGTMWHRTREQQNLADQTREHLDRMDAQYKDTLETKISIEKNLMETTLLNQMISGLLKAQSLDEILFEACHNTVTLMGFDRAIVLMNNEDRSSLSYRASAGLSQSLQEAITQLNLATAIEDTDPYKLSNVYRSGSPILIQDVKKHLRSLKDPTSKLILESSGSASFICVPIQTSTQKLGLLMADCYFSEKTLSDGDVKFLEMVAGQMALAIEREQSNHQIRKVSEAYSRFVPFDLVNLLGYDSVLDIKLGDSVEKDLTVLFCDIREFTHLCEMMSPSETLRFLNSYLRHVSPCIQNNGGFIDKFIGDCIMAIFTKPEDAVQAALDIHAALHSYNAAHRIGQREVIRVGIGIHTGRNIFGPVGSDKKLELTVLSDSVNLASRVGSLTKEFGAGILISGDVAAKIDQGRRDQLRYLGRTQVKGRAAWVRIYEVLEPVMESYPESWPDSVPCHIYFDRINGVQRNKRAAKPLIEEALFAMDFGDQKRAQMTLDTVHQLWPEEKVVSYYKKHSPTPPQNDKELPTAKKIAS